MINFLSRLINRRTLSKTFSIRARSNIRIVAKAPKPRRAPPPFFHPHPAIFGHDPPQREHGCIAGHRRRLIARVHLSSPECVVGCTGAFAGHVGGAGVCGGRRRHASRPYTRVINTNGAKSKFEIGRRYWALRYLIGSVRMGCLLKIELIVCIVVVACELCDREAKFTVIFVYR